MQGGIPEETFGEVVHRLRRRAGMTLEELARRTGRSRGAVRAWEEGAHPRREVFAPLSAALGVPEPALRDLVDAERARGPDAAAPSVVGTDGGTGPTSRREGGDARRLVDLLDLVRHLVARARAARWGPDPVTAALSRIGPGMLERRVSDPAVRAAWPALDALIREVRSTSGECSMDVDLPA